MAENSRPRSRQVVFVLYPESQQESIEYCQKNLPCAWALHDKDTYSEDDLKHWLKKHDGELPAWKPGDLKKPHMHFVCRFKNARYFSGIAKDIGVSENTIEKCFNLYRAYVYLWHDGQVDKVSYPQSIVGTNEAFEVPSENVGVSAAEDEAVQQLLDMPAFGCIEEMARWCFANGCWATFRKNYAMWRDVFVEKRRKALRVPLDERVENMPPPGMAGFALSATPDDAPFQTTFAE